MTQSAEVHSIDNCVALGEDFRESAVAERTSVVLNGTKEQGALLPSTDQNRQWWWLEVVVCTHLAVGLIVDAQIVAGAYCRYTCSSGGQDSQQRPGPTMGLLTEALAVSVLSHGWTGSPRASSLQWRLVRRIGLGHSGVQLVGL